MPGLVSVIIPVYNGAKYMEECIESILNQSHYALEIILIDDGSTDETARIAQKFQAIDQRFNYTYQENRGVSAARNHGLSLVTGEYISFVDIDDTLNPDIYKVLINQLNKDGTFVVALTDYAIYKNKKLNDTDVISKDLAINYMCQLKFPTAVWSYLYRKEALDGISFQPTIHFYEDFHFNYRVMAAQKDISLSEKSLYFYRKHVGNVNNRPLDFKKFSALNIRDDLTGRIDTDFPKSFLAFDAEVFNVLINSYIRSQTHELSHYNTIRQRLMMKMPSLLLSRFVRLRSKVKFTLFILSFRFSKKLKV